MIENVENLFIKLCFYLGETPKAKTTDKLVDLVYKFKLRLKKAKTDLLKFQKDEALKAYK